MTTNLTTSRPRWELADILHRFQSRYEAKRFVTRHQLILMDVIFPGPFTTPASTATVQNVRPSPKKGGWQHVKVNCFLCPIFIKYLRFHMS